MAKGYWIAHVEVTNADGYKAIHVACCRTFSASMAHATSSRGGTMEVVEGKAHRGSW